MRLLCSWIANRKTVSAFIVLVLLTLVLSTLFSAYALSTEYLYLTGKGNSMHPTIMNGDRVQVKICDDGDLIKIGDIIVYGSIAALAYNPNLTSMWIAHSVIEKYQKNGTWYFRTKGDNNTHIDPWEVPEHWLTGIVVRVEHVGQYLDTSTQTKPIVSPKNPFPEQWGILIPIIGGVCLYATMTSIRKQREVNIYTCRNCTNWETQYKYELECINGRLGIRKTLDLQKVTVNTTAKK